MACTIDFSIHDQVVNITIKSCEVYSARRRGTVLRILIRWGRLRLRRMLCLLRLRNLWPLSANPKIYAKWWTYMRGGVGSWKSISARWLRVSCIGRAVVIWEVLRWSRSIAKGLCLRNGYPRTQQGCLLVLVLLSSEPSLAQCIYDSLRDVKAENRSARERPWHWFPPCLESFIELLANITVHQCIGIHKSVVEVASEIDSVWSSNVLDN